MTVSLTGRLSQKFLQIVCTVICFKIQYNIGAAGHLSKVGWGGLGGDGLTCDFKVVPEANLGIFWKILVT